MARPVEVRMRRGGVIAVVISFLAACSDGRDRRSPVPPSPVRVTLPTADTGAIDPATLEGRITFSAGADFEDEDVYVMDAAGSGVTRLTENDVADFDPTWSPDGTRIAFRSQRDGNDEIYVMNADGSAQRNLTNDAAVDWGPAWSPDGRWIAFNSGRADPRHLRGFLTDPRGERAEALGKLFFEYPAWSPDGERIAFMHQTFSRAGGNYDIYVMNADGTGIRELTNSPADDGWPVWSPDGRSIAFSSVRDDCAFRERKGCKTTGDIGDFHTLYVMGADGSRERRVTDVFGQFAAWSPDGRYLAVTPAPGGYYVMRPDGSDLTLVPVDVPSDPLFPDWVS